VATIRKILPAEQPTAPAEDPATGSREPLPLPKASVPNRYPVGSHLGSLAAQSFSGCLCPRFGDRLDGSVNF
jgi:hypothetical protein